MKLKSTNNQKGGSQKKDYTFNFETSVSEKNRELVTKYLLDKNGWTRKNYSFTQTSNPDIKVFFVDNDDINRIFKGQKHLYNLSVTDSSTRPIKIYFNKKNWNNPPEAYNTNSNRLEKYRKYLVNHEFGHALGFNHAKKPEKNSGKDCPVMLQQSKFTEPYCKANSNV